MKIGWKSELSIHILQIPASVWQVTMHVMAKGREMRRQKIPLMHDWG
jgi:hypothetical protein